MHSEKIEIQETPQFLRADPFGKAFGLFSHKSDILLYIGNDKVEKKISFEGFLDLF